MKEIIIELLKELTSYGYRKFDGVLIKKADSEMGFKNLFQTIDDLLAWQKSVAIKWESDIYFEDHFAFEEELQTRFDDFFKYAPELKEIFELEKGKVSYNENLDSGDIAEIRKYVDDNYTPFFHMSIKKK